MAADSGYHSFSLPRLPFVDHSSETSNSLDPQEFANGQTVSEIQSIDNSSTPQCLQAASETPTYSQSAIPLITSTTANKTNGSNKYNLSRKANAISTLGASTKAGFLIKANVSRESRGDGRVQRSALAISQPSTPTISRDDDNGQIIGSLLASAGMEAALAHHFKVAVNMTEHMNYAFSHSEAKHGIKQRVMEEVKALAEEMIYFFDGLQESLKIQIEGLKEAKSYLPTLGDNVEEHHLETAIKIWTEKICENVRKPRKREQHLLNNFAGVYDANVYHPFLQLHRRDARHNIRELSVHLDSVYNAIEGTIELYEEVILDMSELRQALEGAFHDFRRLPHAWFDSWGSERFKAKAQISQSTTPSMPSTPSALTDVESDDKARLSTLTGLHAKALEWMGRAAGRKREVHETIAKAGENV